MFVVILFMVLATALLSWSWVKGISYMKENHPDYKGEDFLNWDGKNTDWDSVPHTAGRDGWELYDEDAVHTEGEI